MVILIFIFLTPNWWFASGERLQNEVHQSPVTTTVVLTPEVVGNEGDRSRIEAGVQEHTGRTKFEIVEVRTLRYPDGRIRSFEVDIR